MKKDDIIRAFIAFDIDDDEVLSRIEEIQGEFRKIDGKIKFVEKQNIHITLKFLGDIKMSTAEKIHEILQGIKSLPEAGFEVKVEDVGVFNKKRPRVLWCKIKDKENHIINIQKEIDVSLKEKLDIPREKRPFKGHVTIGRIRYLKNLPGFDALLEKYKNIQIGTITLSKISFKKSTLTPKGPIYTELTF
ncbi:MAG: RNA 2',3'-cyclic phosphodiesterase [Promethearchaeota archaeon]